MTPSDRKRILGILELSETRLTSRAYINKIAAELSISRRSAGKILKTLVDGQELAYEDLYGATYVDISFSKPVRVTDHFFLKPPKVSSRANPGQVDINLLPGISFGSGHHATTRLCLKAIDHLFFHSGTPQPDTTSACADIGTGSGVLAIALCLSGMPSCRAWDTDPNAVSESRKNIELNHLTRKIEVMGCPMPGCENEFSLICANLRFPTLKNLSSLIRSSLKPGGFVILSGVREWEREELILHYSQTGLVPDWQRDEKEWSAVVLKDRA
ncbi:50S ribosomal protein L11 methyltransferase [Desulfospira joergensenii]|uniref:50S ribosomal protein L11 methyltransferase n=1 Tax=Desulfospira joergensenii TaxID=53329 RepID=UPI0003B541D0|nr:50S ribosomal protein L11 methyltransferase [Desulfospira joergensenii]